VDASASLERIREYVERHREHFATPGLSLAVTDRERHLGAWSTGSPAWSPGTPSGAALVPDRIDLEGFTALAVSSRWRRDGSSSTRP
jgi:hypothetical protein